MSHLTTTSRIRVVQYNPYKHPRRFTECEIKQISVNGQPGASLKLALSNELVGLDCGSDTFFQASGPKFTYRIDIPSHPVVTQQKYAYRIKNRRKVPITVEAAVKQVAEVVCVFLEQAKKADQDHLQLRFGLGPGSIELEDLYLLELRRSGATIQPVLGYIAPEFDVASVGPSNATPEPALFNLYAVGGLDDVPISFPAMTSPFNFPPLYYQISQIYQMSANYPFPPI